MKIYSRQVEIASGLSFFHTQFDTALIQIHELHIHQMKNNASTKVLTINISSNFIDY